MLPELFRTSGLTKSLFSPILNIRFYERRRAECPMCTLQRVLFWFRGPVCRFCAPGSGDKRPCFVPCCALLRQERRFLFIAAVPLREKAVTVSISTSPGNQKKGEIFYGNAIDPVAGEGAAHRALSARQHPLFCRGPAVRLPRDGIQCPHAAGHPSDGGLHPRRRGAVAPGVSAAASAAAAGAEASRAVARGRGGAAAGPAARLLQLWPAHAAFARVGVVRQAHPRRAV